jgi:hypothetical protein
MERFLKRYEDRITGILSGFDRLLFRGSLRSISYVDGLQIFLNAEHVLLKDFAGYVERLTARLKTHAADLAERTGRPFLYLPASRTSKEEVIRQLLKTTPVSDGLIAIFPGAWNSHAPRMRAISTRSRCWATRPPRIASSIR